MTIYFNKEKSKAKGKCEEPNCIYILPMSVDAANISISNDTTTRNGK